MTVRYLERLKYQSLSKAYASASGVALPSYCRKLHIFSEFSLSDEIHLSEVLRVGLILDEE